MTDQTVITRDLPPERPVAQAMLRGFRCRCPNCGEGRMFRAFLKTEDACPVCGEDLSHHRADDAPPYITIALVGHLLVPIMLVALLETRLPDWVHLAIWVPLTIIATMALIQPVKGAVVALQWALRMHGFDPAGGEESALPDVSPSTG